MRVHLALATLTRHRARTGLAVLGVAIAAAMLLDMVMLSSGMRESFATLLESRGFSMRLSPRGTIPFDTEATIAGASDIVETLSHNPDITVVSPVLGATVHVVEGARAGASVAWRSWARRDFSISRAAKRPFPCRSRRCRRWVARSGAIARRCSCWLSVMVPRRTACKGGSNG